MRLLLVFFILWAFIINSLAPYMARADVLPLPGPGVMVLLKGIKVHPDNPFHFDFILDKGDSKLSQEALKEESRKLIKYFLVGLTIPEKNLWQTGVGKGFRIVPEKAVVFENAQGTAAYVVESKLKVMLERGTSQLPELERKVNEDNNFVQLRRVYNSLILATWYKKKYFSGAGAYSDIDQAMTVINKPSTFLKNILVGASAATLLILSVDCSAVIPTMRAERPMNVQPTPQVQVFADETERASFAGTGQVARTIADAQTMAVPTLAGDIAFHFEDRSKSPEEYLKAEEVSAGYRYTLPSDLTVQEATQLMDSIRRLKAGGQPLAGVIAQSIIPWTAKPPEYNLQQQIELETLLYWRGVQIFSQELLAGKTDLKGLQEGIKKAARLGESKMSQAQEKAIRQIVDIIRRLPGWKNEDYMESSPQIGRLTREINCVLRSALAAFYLRNLGIRVWGLSMYKHQSLLAQLQNGQYLIVEPSSLDSVDVTKVDLPFPGPISASGNLVYLQKYARDVLIYDWHKGIMASFYKSLGFALEAMGKLPQAIEAYDKAIALSPKDAEVYNNKGVALEAMGKLSEANEAYDKAIGLNSKDVEVYNNKGVALEAMGKLSQANEAYDKAIELNPKDAEVYNNKGVVLRAMGKSAKAIEAYDKAIGLNPKDAEVYNNKGLALEIMGKLSEAVAAFDEAIVLNPKYTDAYYNKGNALQAMGKSAKAIEAYDKAIVLNPKGAKIYNNKGVALEAMGKLSEAAAAFDEAIGLNPNDAEAYNNKGVTLEAMGKLSQANEAYDKAIELNPKRAYAYYNKGLVLKKMGNEKEAQQVFQQITKLFSSSPPRENRIIINIHSLSSLSKFLSIDG